MYQLNILLTIAVFQGSGSAQLIKTNDCTCPDDIITYNCNVTGSGFTIWRGSAFDCPTVDSRILVRHSSFRASIGLCNDGVIIGHSLGVDTNSLSNPIYISQLTINLTAAPSVVGQTVECVYRNPGGIDTLIGSTVITIMGIAIFYYIELIDLVPFSWKFRPKILSANIFSRIIDCMHRG